MSRVPRIRFKGFEEDWEQRKLGELAERLTRKNEKLESTLPLTISAQQGLVDQNDFFDKRIASKDVSGYYLIRKGEFAYNKSTSMDAPFGAIKRLDKYGSGVLSTLYIVFKILDDNSTNSDYIVAYYDTNLWHKAIQSIAAEGARNHGLLNIVPNDFFKTILSIPKNISEQKKIGTFIQYLDYLITLHQRKLEKLKIIKKSMLENLFPKNKEKTPRIRFSGFSEDWEQRKFSDLAETHRGLTYKPSDIRNAGTRVLRSSNIIEDQFTYGDDDVFVEPDAVNIPYANQGDILITSANGSTRLVGKHTIIRDIANNSAVHGGFMLLATAENPGFVNALMSAPWYTKFISLYVAGGNGAIGNLNKSDLDEQDVFDPGDTEQKVIDRYFSQLDHLITLHQLEPYYRIFKAIAYRIIDYAEYKFFNIKINLIYDILQIDNAYIRNNIL